MTGCTSEEKKNALNDFEQAKEVVEKLNVDLDKLVSESEELILKKEAALDVSTLSNLACSSQAISTQEKARTNEFIVASTL